jgi:hypothetical protein
MVAGLLLDLSGSRDPWPKVVLPATLDRFLDIHPGVCLAAPVIAGLFSMARWIRARDLPTRPDLVVMFARPDRTSAMAH